ncbi:MAG: Uma2 family endonuclease [Defluviitaleaceae bacterium]|nr:Uma2 family endonuclease [Defluviitaleaceae bacterium]
MTNLTLEYPNGYKDELPNEILDGIIYPMARPGAGHIDVAYNISSIFKNYLKTKLCRAYIEPYVYFEKDDQVIPDVAIICDLERWEGYKYCGVPALVVEILSRSTSKRDKGYKKDLYERHGVQEYWIVEVASQTIEVYLLKDDKYILSNVYAELKDWEIESLSEKEREKFSLTFKVHLYDDFVIDVREVFEDVGEY